MNLLEPLDSTSSNILNTAESLNAERNLENFESLIDDLRTLLALVDLAKYHKGKI